MAPWTGIRPISWLLGTDREYDIDYEETFVPLAKMTTLRIILAFTTSQKWSLRQIDVKNAILHGDLKEEIYMSPPLGMFKTPSSEVWRLRRSLYGLKQAPRAWFNKFCSTLLAFHFIQSQFDSSLFLHQTSAGIVLFIVYVDDIVITGSDNELLQHLQKHFHDSFHMKDLDPLQYFLGLEVQITLTGTLLHQHKYTEEVISLAGLQMGNSVLTPLEVNVKLRQEKGELLSDPSLYR
ncbi:hypothetical protein OIU76_005553 [Salix suchowensis]|nr:hypothetical protein OIU76_005553 [Salix suchowensis]